MFYILRMYRIDIRNYNQYSASVGSGYTVGGLAAVLAEYTFDWWQYISIHSILESRPRCDVIRGKSKVVRLNCSIYAVGNLNIILTHPKYTKVPQPKKTNNNVYSVELEAELARTCRICFTAGSDGSTCVLQTDFDDYRPSTTIPGMEHGIHMLPDQ